MDDRLKHLLEEAEKIKKKRVMNLKRREQFLKHDMKVIHTFAEQNGAEVSVRESDGFVHAMVTAPELVISDLDREVKQLLMDDAVSITFRQKKNQLVMDIILRIFSVDHLR